MLLVALHVKVVVGLRPLDKGRAAAASPILLGRQVGGGPEPGPGQPRPEAGQLMHGPEAFQRDGVRPHHLHVVDEREAGQSLGPRRWRRTLIFVLGSQKIQPPLSAKGLGAGVGSRDVKSRLFQGAGAVEP